MLRSPAMDVVTPVTFALITSVPHYLWTIPYRHAGAPAACGGVCVQDPLCGGFVYDRSLWPPCRLVVGKSVDGAAAHDFWQGVYRLTSYRAGRFKLHELQSKRQSWNETRQSCLDIGMDLPPYPASVRDHAALGVRGSVWVYVDVHRPAAGVFVSLRDRTTVPEEVVSGSWGPTQPDEPGPAYLMAFGGGISYFDVSASAKQIVSLICAFDVTI